MASELSAFANPICIVIVGMNYRKNWQVTQSNEGMNHELVGWTAEGMNTNIDSSREMNTNADMDKNTNMNS